MHEIILILLIVGISALPTGFFVKYDIPDDKSIKEPKFTKRRKVGKDVIHDDDATKNLSCNSFI